MARFTENRPALPAPATLLVLAAALFAALPSAPAVPERAAPPASTVEPTLPLRIDLDIESIERSGGRARGLLRIDLVAIDEVRDVEIDVLHDDALSIPGEATLRLERLRLRRGERRDFRMEIEAKADRDLPLRLEATFRTADGTLLRLGQGITLERSKTFGEGRLHLGALEYPALVLDGPQP